MSEKTCSFCASCCPAIQQQKLLSSLGVINFAPFTQFLFAHGDAPTSRRSVHVQSPSPASVKTASFYAGCCRAIRQQKLLSGPRFGVFESKCYLWSSHGEDLKTEILPETIPLKSRFSVRGLTVSPPPLWPSPNLRRHQHCVSLLRSEPPQRCTRGGVRAVAMFSGGTSPRYGANLDFTGFDSRILLILRGGIPRSMGNFPEV